MRSLHTGRHIITYGSGDPPLELPGPAPSLSLSKGTYVRLLVTWPLHPPALLRQPLSLATPAESNLG